MTSSYEELAIEAVIEYEAKRGRKARDVRKTHLGKGIDVISDTFAIQVKQTEAEKPTAFWLTATDFMQLQNNPKYRVYFVYNVRKKPQVLPLKPETIRRHVIPELRFHVRPSAEEWQRIVQDANLTGELGS
jgi:hypothetical protein